MTFPSCHYCGAETDQTLGAWPCCRACRYGKVPHYARRGRPEHLRADHGPDQYDLFCLTCGATWVGAAWERCGWCERALANQIAGQRTLVLMEPDNDPDENDKELQNRAEAWSRRLAIAIDAGLVTGREADHAVKAWLVKVESWRSRL